MPNNKKTNKTPKGAKQMSRAFRGVRDPVVVNASAVTPAVYTMNTDGAGAFSGTVSFSPLGLAGVVYTVPSPNTPGTVIIPTYTTFTSPTLPWLYNQSRGFERYRVTRAVAIWVSSVGSTVSGRLMLDSSTDYADAATINGISTSTGGKVFDLASGAVREFRHAMDVDSSWKKVSSAVSMVGVSTSSVVTVNTVNDLQFSTLFVVITGGPTNTNCGSLFVEYDVEFKDPISFGANV